MIPARGPKVKKHLLQEGSAPDRKRRPGRAAGISYHLYFIAMATQFWCVGSTFLLPWVLLP